MILKYSISVKYLAGFLKFRIGVLAIIFYSSLLHGQQDSLEIERLYTLGMENVRVQLPTAIGSFENAICIINDSILTKEEHKYFLLKKALILDQLSFCYRISSKDVLSLEAALESLKIKENLKETYTLANTYKALGRLYQHKSDSAKAMQFYDKALVLSTQYGNHEGVVNTLNGYSGYYYYVLKDLETGKSYAERALKYADSIDYPKGKSLALSRLASYERRKKNYIASASYSKKSIEVSKRINDRIGLERNFKALGYAYRKLGQPQKAVFFYKKSLEMVHSIGLVDYIANRHLSLSNAYTDVGNHEQAFAHYRGYKRQQIKDMNLKSYKEFNRLEAKYTYEREKTIDSLELVKTHKIKEAQLIQEASTRFWKITAILVGLFGIIIAIIIFLLRKRKEQVKLEKLKNEMLQKEIDYKQKDISDFALNISRNHKWREKLLTHIKKIKKSSSLKDDTNFKALEKAVLEKDVVDNNMIDFQNKVDVLNTAFYEKLHKEFPSLTKTEAKLCSFIRLNIDNNEIAILQNIALESVYRSRSRLRKKLNLSPKEDLNAFLNKF